MLSLTNRSRQSGLSIVELMVGAAVALIVVIGSFAFYMSTLRSGFASQRQLRLTQETRAVMDILMQDARRIGYWANAAGGGANPFTVRTAGSGTDLFLQGNCLLYTYDATFLTGNTAGSVDSRDYFGFRLNGTTMQMLPDNPGYTDTSGSCANLAWQNLTDNTDVSITSMTSTITYKCLHQTSPLTATSNGTTPCSTSQDIESRTLNVTLTAASVSDSTITITVADSVLLPNNRLVP